MKIVKYYSVLDFGYKSKEQAMTALEGWEHKEKVYEEYVILDIDEEPVEINLADNEFYHFRNLKDALEHVEEDRLDKLGLL